MRIHWCLSTAKNDSKFFLESGYKVVALDGSKEMCRQASAYLGQAVQCRCFEEIEKKCMMGLGHVHRFYMCRMNYC